MLVEIAVKRKPQILEIFQSPLQNI